jgi:hypothetical protein
MAKTLARKQQKRGGKRARKTQKRMRGGIGSMLPILALALMTVAANANPTGNWNPVRFNAGRNVGDKNSLEIDKNVFDQMVRFDPKLASVIQTKPDYLGSTYIIPIDCKKDIDVANEIAKTEGVPQEFKDAVKKMNDDIICSDDNVATKYAIENAKYAAEQKKKREEAIAKRNAAFENMNAELNKNSFVNLY